LLNVKLLGAYVPRRLQTVNFYFKHGTPNNVQGVINYAKNILTFGHSFLLCYLKPVHGIQSQDYFTEQGEHCLATNCIRPRSFRNCIVHYIKTTTAKERLICAQRVRVCCPLVDICVPTRGAAVQCKLPKTARHSPQQPGKCIISR